MTHWFEHWIPRVMQQWSYLGIAFPWYYFGKWVNLDWP